MTARPPEAQPAAGLVQPALRAAVGGLADEQMRLIGSYQLGWCDAAGNPGGQRRQGRPGALAVLSAQAAGCPAEAALPAAVAVELVHNFSLLHDDIMDRDVERRHQPTGWVVFGEGPAILAGTALLTLAGRAGADRRRGACAAAACWTPPDADQRPVRRPAPGTRRDRERGRVLQMEAGKTAALLACAAELGPAVAGAPAEVTAALARYGHELGMAFQLIDDVLGINGDPAVTGKSASSDLRAGKRAPRSWPRCAAPGRTTARRPAARRATGGPTTTCAIAAKLVDEAGGIDWAQREARSRVEAGRAELRSAGLVPAREADLVALGRYILERDR